MAKFLGSLLLIFSWPLTVMWRGYVITILWAWFAVPATGVRQISIYEAVAALILFAAITPWHISPEDKREAGEELFLRLGLVTIGPALILLMAWVWKTLQWGIA